MLSKNGSQELTDLGWEAEEAPLVWAQDDKRLLTYRPKNFCKEKMNKWPTIHTNEIGGTHAARPRNN
jgi:hypothetical protein